MAIVRLQVNEYLVSPKKSKKLSKTQRKRKDYDLAWGEQRVYVLDENEWFDPLTSSKYSDAGVSRHAMYGPAIIILTTNSCAGSSACEYHVNDPRAWAFVRRSIREGHLNSKTILRTEVIDDEKDVKISE